METATDNLKGGSYYMFQIDLRGGRGAIYQQLREEVVRLCSLGVLKPDDQLPSVRALARDLGINPNTVAKAYSQLEAEGITYSVPGKGSFISGDTVRMGEVRRKMLEEFTEETKKARSLGFSQEELQKIIETIYQADE
jgi:GntR family transcriptional regulator